MTPNRPMVPRRRAPSGPVRPRPPAPRRAGPLRWLRRLIGLMTGIGLLVALVVAAIGWHFYEQASVDLPTLEGLRHYQPQVMSRVYADDEALISELAAERRIFVPLSAIPDRVKQAFVAAEDQNFWTHRGIDPMAIARAAWMDFLHMGQGRRPIGASTITQQVAKNMLLGSNQVSLGRKAREALLAIRIEDTLTKDRILELYLNEIYLGQGAYGVAAAAQAYFNKGLDELTLDEAAFLGALPKAPNNYNPFRNPDAARGRRDWVLDRMAETGAITPLQAKEARARPLDPAPFRRAEIAAGAEWFGEDVRRQLVDKFGDSAMTAGLAVQTSLDPALQAEADRVLRSGLMAYDRRFGGWRGPVARLDGGPAFRLAWPTALAGIKPPRGMLPDWHLAVVLDVSAAGATVGWLDQPPGSPASAAAPRQGALRLSDTGWARPARGSARIGGTPHRMADVVRPGDVVMVGQADPADSAHMLLRQVPQVQGAIVSVEPATGRVLAMSGGWRFEASQFNRATQAQRQPGSAFKPMVYLTAMEQDISPSRRFDDAPFSMDMGSQGVWRPNNYEMTFEGPTPLQVALEKSLNLVTIRLAQRVTMAQVAKTAIAFHVVDQMPRVLPAALGAVDTTVLRMAGAYASMAAGGRDVIPTLIDLIQDRDGHVIYRAPGLACRGCADSGAPPKLEDGRPQIADAASVFQMVTMMQGVVNRGTGIEAGRGLGRAIAGKTGTSQDFNDAWFVGFTPDLATAVWIGFDQPASLGDKETGGAVAGPLWHDFMAYALRDRPHLQFRKPEGVTMARWETSTGSAVDAFKPGQVPGAGGGGGGGGEDAADEGAAGSDADRAYDAPPRSAPAAPAPGGGMGGLY